jgi:hypothetical protein
MRFNTGTEIGHIEVARRMSIDLKIANTPGLKVNARVVLTAKIKAEHKHNLSLKLANVYEKRGRQRCWYFRRFTTMKARSGREAQFHFLESTQKSE